MAPIEEEHEHYHPKDAVHLGLKGAAVVGGIGLLFAAVRTSLARKNVGPWAIFTRNGKLAATFAAVGGAYDFTRAAAANLREKEDWVNNGIGGLFAGATMGLTTGRIPRVLGFAALTGVVLATAEYAGSGLRGVFKRDVDEYERKEFLRKNRRRPIEETLAEIGEGRGIKPPGYYERRAQRLKEKYGVDINPVCADPDQA